MAKTLYYHYNEYVSVTREATEPKWDRDDTYTSRELSYEFSDSRNHAYNSYDTFVVEDSLADLDELYLIVVEYSTGDSFGYDENARLAVIAAFSSMEQAEKIAKELKNANDKDYDFKASNGEAYYRPWVGYFERLNEMHVIAVNRVNKKHKRI